MLLTSSICSDNGAIVVEQFFLYWSYIIDISLNCSVFFPTESEDPLAICPLIFCLKALNIKASFEVIAFSTPPK